MKLFKLLILGAAAYGGYLYYNRFHAASNVLEGSSRSDNSAYYGSSTNNTGKYGNVGGIGSIGGLGNVEYFDSPNRVNNTAPMTSAGNNMDNILILRAAAEGDKEKIEKLLKNTDPDTRDSFRRTPLIHAAWHGHKEVCAKLLAAGANIEFQDREGFNTLDYAAGTGQRDMVDFLLKVTGMNDKNHYREFSSLMASVLGNHLDYLPETGKMPYINRVTPLDQSPIHTAASNGYVPMAERLVALGANIKLQNHNKRTPLHWAAWNNRADMIVYLLKHGAVIDAQDTVGNTPLLMATENNATDAVKALITAGAKQSMKNNKGQTALMIALDKGYQNLTAILQ